jgi:HSP20 family protein
MPGVSRDRLNIQADKQTLTISGDVQVALPQGMEAVLAEVQSTQYRRSFALSGELDSAQAQATLKDGVLSLRIPKRAELRPRRIEVRAT